MAENEKPPVICYFLFSSIYFNHFMPWNSMLCAYQDVQNHRNISTRWKYCIVPFNLLFIFSRSLLWEGQSSEQNNENRLLRMNVLTPVGKTDFSNVCLNKQRSNKNFFPAKIIYKHQHSKLIIPLSPPTNNIRFNGNKAMLVKTPLIVSVRNLVIEYAEFD